MPKAWKIAPGKGASHWELCREAACILLGWRELDDLRKYRTPADALKRLQKVHGVGAKGASRGAAEMVCQFLCDVKKDDVVVANNGYRGIAGIGVVVSGYLA